MSECHDDESTCGNPAGGRNNNNDNSMLSLVDSGKQAAGADAESVCNLPSKKEESAKMVNHQENRSKHPSARLPFAHPTLHIPGQLTLAELEALDAQNQDVGTITASIHSRVSGEMAMLSYGSWGRASGLNTMGSEEILATTSAGAKNVGPTLKAVTTSRRACSSQRRTEPSR